MLFTSPFHCTFYTKNVVSYTIISIFSSFKNVPFGVIKFITLNSVFINHKFTCTYFDSLINTTKNYVYVFVPWKRFLLKKCVTCNIFCDFVLFCVISSNGWERCLRWWLHVVVFIYLKESQAWPVSLLYYPFQQYGVYMKWR